MILTIFFCYVYLKISEDTVGKNNYFFASDITSFFSLSFYLFYFHKIIHSGYYRFIALNFSLKRFTDYKVKNLLAIVFIGVLLNMIVYVSTTIIYYQSLDIDFIYFFKFGIFFILYQMFLCLLSFCLMSLSYTIWALFLAMGYWFFEDTIIYLIKYPIAKYLPKSSFTHLFSEPFHYEYLAVCLGYLFILSFLGYKVNHKKL
ncbi:hypothetical protein SAMN05421544_10466 [Riemerella columbipharyngis]|uniref:Uncharacterized protein n=2 Tax=Riemerella columbipharyngis TaxID=1071918 RepID=A0A1G7AR63_9FLAO|nr:hypothetical protein SAMN05421544_10466 [Riemerella columbipharyngis]